MERAPDSLSPPTNIGAKANHSSLDDESLVIPASESNPATIHADANRSEDCQVEKRCAAKAERTDRIKFRLKAVLQQVAKKEREKLIHELTQNKALSLLSLIS